MPSLSLGRFFKRGRQDEQISEHHPNTRKSVVSQESESCPDPLPLRLGSFLDRREATSISEHELLPKPLLLSRDNPQCLEPPSETKGEDTSPRPEEDTPELSYERGNLTTYTADNASTGNLTGKSSSQKSAHCHKSTTKSHNNPEPQSKAGSSTSVDPDGLNGSYYRLLFSTLNSNDNTKENPPPLETTTNPATSPDKVPHPLPPPPCPLPTTPLPPTPTPPPSPAPAPALTPAVEPPSLDNLLTQEVPTKYLPVNAHLPHKVTWLDVLSLAQSVLAPSEEKEEEEEEEEKEKPVIQQSMRRNKVNLITFDHVSVSRPERDSPASADLEDAHSLLWAKKSRVTEAEHPVDNKDDKEYDEEDSGDDNGNDDDGDDGDEDGETVRSSFSSFDIRDVNLSLLHKEVSTTSWSWREKWRGTASKRGAVVLEGYDNKF